MSLLGALIGMLSVFLKVDDPTGFPPPLPAEKEREYFRQASLLCTICAWSPISSKSITEATRHRRIFCL